MNQLQIVHKKISTSNKNQKTEPVEENRREEDRIAALALFSPMMYRLENSNVFFIESFKPSIAYYSRYLFNRQEIVSVHVKVLSSEDIREIVSI